MILPTLVPKSSLGRSDTEEEKKKEDNTELFSSLKPKPLQVSVGGPQKPSASTSTTTPMPPIEEEKDRVTRFLEDPEMADILATKKQERAEEIGYDEFSQEMEAMLPEPEEFDISVTELAESPTFIRLASKYLTDRVGKQAGDLETYGSKEEFVERYISHTRALADNMGSVAKELSYIRTLSDEEKQDLAALYSLTPVIATAGSKGGTPLMDAIIDHTIYTVTDPSMAIGGIAGATIKRLVAKDIGTMTLQQALVKNRKAAIATAGVESVLGAVESAKRQQLDIETGRQEDIDYAQVAVQTGLQGVLGYMTAGTGAYMGGRQSASDKLDERLKLKAPTAEARAKALQENADKFKETVANYDPLRGTAVRERLSGATKPEPSAVDPQIRVTIQNETLDMVGEWASRNQEVANYINNQLDAEEKISDIVMRLLSLDEEAGKRVGFSQAFEDLDGLLKQSGVDRKDFAQAFRGSVEDFATGLGQLRGLQRRIRTVAQEDPYVAAVVDDLFKVTERTRDWNLLQRLDAETRAILVSGIGTTVRNVLGGVSYVTFKTAADTIETTIYHTVKGVKAASTGNGSIDGFKKGIGEMIHDSTYLLARSIKQGESEEMASRLLVNNPEIEKMLFHTTQGISDTAGTKELSALAKGMNVLNIAQDGIFRRGIFTARTDYYLRQANLPPLEEFLAANKPVPTKVLQKAADDALYGTFAYHPKNKGIKTPKAAVETVANTFVRVQQKYMSFLPVAGTGDVPFARFMGNALSYSYKYSPAQFFSPTAKMAGAGVDNVFSRFTNKKADALTPEDWRLIREKYSTAIAGSASMYGLYKLKEYEDEKYGDESKAAGATYLMVGGKPKDFSAVFPLGPQLIAVDVMRKYTSGRGSEVDLVQTVKDFVGLTNKTGSGATLDYMLESLGDMLNSDGTVNEDVVSEERFQEWAGQFLGAQASRVGTPLQIFSDTIAAFDSEEDIVRDRYQYRVEKETVVDAEGNEREIVVGNRFSQAFLNELLYKTPVAKQQLPKLSSPTRTGDIYMEDSFLRQFTGYRTEAPKTLVETELGKFGISSSKVIPYKKEGVARDFLREASAKFIEEGLMTRIAAPDYQEADRDRQQRILENELFRLRKFSTLKADAASNEALKTEQEVVDYMSRSAWSEQSKRDRKLVNDYLASRDLPTIDDSGDYRRGNLLVTILKGAIK